MPSPPCALLPRLRAVYMALDGQKSPKIIAEALKWIETTLPEFGTAGVRIRDLIGFLKSNLDSSNVVVRKGATSVLVVLRIAVGPGTPRWLTRERPIMERAAHIGRARSPGPRRPRRDKEPARGHQAGAPDDGAGRVRQGRRPKGARADALCERRGHDHCGRVLGRGWIERCRRRGRGRGVVCDG